VRATAESPTVTWPDLDEVRDVKRKALRPDEVVVLDRTTEVTLLATG
jgi:hypothetical protein